MRRRQLWGLAWAGPVLASESQRPVLEIEVRWVELAVPRGAAPTPGPTWSTRRPSDAVRPLGPPLRVGAGESAGWRLRRERPWAWVRLPHGGAEVQTPWPGAAGAGEGELRVHTRWQGAAAPVLLRLQWVPAPDGERPEPALDTTLPVPLSRWVAVLREAEPVPRTPPSPGETRSADAAPLHSRELQVRVRVVLDPATP